MSHHTEPVQITASKELLDQMADKWSPPVRVLFKWSPKIGWNMIINQSDDLALADDVWRRLQAVQDTVKVLAAELDELIVLKEASK